MKDFSRQAFLGKTAPDILKNAIMGIVGYGGCGSHLGQQFAHIGIGHIVVADDDMIEDSNSTRLVGSNATDVADGMLKTDIAERLIKSINPDIIFENLPVRWQDATDRLSKCDIIFGALDSYNERDELERFCRRNLIPYIDIGMDVQKMDDGTFYIYGQVIQSLPGGHCMRCCNFITDEKLKIEAKKYGDAGPRPQVIWPNGVLASTAVGFGISLLCPWSNLSEKFRYIVYNGNSGEMNVPSLVDHLATNTCTHHPITELGDPLCHINEFDRLPNKEILDIEEKTVDDFRLATRLLIWFRKFYGR